MDADDELEDQIYAHTTATGEEDFARTRLRALHDVKLDEPPFISCGNVTAPCTGDHLMLRTGGCQVEVLRQCFEKMRIEDLDIYLFVDAS